MKHAWWVAVFIACLPLRVHAARHRIDRNVGTAPQDVLPPPADPKIKFAPPNPPPPEQAQLLIHVETQRSTCVKVVDEDGEHACPEKVNRLKPCAMTLSPGHVAIWLDNGIHTTVELPPGPTQVTLTKERWTLTIPGVVLMSAGLVLEIVGATADSVPTVLTGLGIMGVGTGVLLVGIFVPMDVVNVKHEEFENVIHTRAPDIAPSRHIGATLTLRF